MPTITARTGKVAFQEYGVGTPLVLLHANPGDHRDFDAIIPTLTERYRVIAVDWPGYGESPAPIPPQSSSAMLYADVLEDIVVALNLERAIFMGNSVGGFASARLAITQPERVRGLVLVSTGGFTPPGFISRWFCRIKGMELVTRLIATRFAKSYLKLRNAHTAQILVRTETGRKNPTTVAVDAAIWRSFAHPEHDLRERAARITAPTLIISGRYDPVLKAEVDGRSAAASIPGSRFEILETGHEPFAEDPDAFLKIVSPFLQQVDSTAPQSKKEVAKQYVASHA